MRVYKQTFSRHLSPLLFGILCFLSLLIFSILYGLGLEEIQVFVIILSCVFSLGIFLHIEYLLLDYGKVLEIDLNKIQLSKNGRPVIICYIDDVESIILHRSASMEGFAFTLALSDYYYYYRFRLKSGEEFLFTRLIADKADGFLEQFEGVEIVKKRSFFNSTFWSPQINFDL